MLGSGVTGLERVIMTKSLGTIDVAVMNEAPICLIVLPDVKKTLLGLLEPPGRLELREYTSGGSLQQQKAAVR